ncbi:MAG: Cof-type HAD-IIB family hydrolase [Erysipelotrichaceae bacterium]
MKGIIALDVDKTLLNDDKLVSPKTIEALKKAYDLGYLTLICSGRDTMGLTFMAKQWGIDQYIRAYAGYNGGEAYDCLDQKLIVHQALDKSIVESIVKYLDAHPYVATYYARDYVGTSKNNPYRDYLCSVMDRGYKEYDDISVEFPDDCCKMVFFDDKENLEVIKEIILNNQDRDDFYLVYSADHILEVMPKGVDKSLGIRYFMDKYQIPLEKTMAVGDNDNDLEMLEFAFHSYAMGNSRDNIKNVCKYVTNDNNHDGAGEAIFDYLKKQPIV